MTKLADTILKKVEAEDITPIPAWYFTLSNLGFWAMWAASLLLGGVSMTMIIFMLVHAGWEYQALVSDSPVRFLAIVIPYLWIICLGSMIFLSWFQIRHTRYGYRHSFTWLIVISLLLSTIFGLAGYIFGIGRIIDNAGWRYAALFYERLQPPLFKNLPENKGILAGIIIERPQAGFVTVRSFGGEIWTVAISQLTSEDQELLTRVRRVLFHGFLLAEDQTFAACNLLKPAAVRETRILPPRVTNCEDQAAAPLDAAP